MSAPFRPRISLSRRAVAWGLLLLLVLGGVALLRRFATHPGVAHAASLVFWILAALVLVKGLAFFLLDPLLRSRKTATPGFARDLLLFVAYFIAGALILRYVVGVTPGQILGTGALAAAVVGLSLQETLGNLFSGLALHLDSAFQVGDWIEVSGTGRREPLVGWIEAITWRTVHLRTEDGDTEILPNRVLAQSAVTNLFRPAGYHRRAGRLTLEPRPDLDRALAAVTRALAGLPHPLEHPPQAVITRYEQGAVLEMRWWALGYLHDRASRNEAFRLAASVLPREGFELVGPCAAFPARPADRTVDPARLTAVVASLGLPEPWTRELLPAVRRCELIAGEGVIREGEPGESLFAVLSGRLRVVRPVRREEPYPGLFWETEAELGPGDWFGEASLLTGAPRNATVVAATAAELVEIPRAPFEAVLKRDPQVVEHLVDLMASRLRDAGDRPAESGGRRREQWLDQIRNWFHLSS